VVEVGKFADVEVQILRGLEAGEEVSVDSEINSQLTGPSAFGG
jgi:hypothetical protein